MVPPGDDFPTTTPGRIIAVVTFYATGRRTPTDAEAGDPAVNDGETPAMVYSY